jgi:hypothetical protein
MRSPYLLTFIAVMTIIAFATLGALSPGNAPSTTAPKAVPKLVKSSV